MRKKSPYAAEKRGKSLESGSSILVGKFSEFFPPYRHDLGCTTSSKATFEKRETNNKRIRKLRYSTNVPPSFGVGTVVIKTENYSYFGHD
jgi:hypothetical protein